MINIEKIENKICTLFKVTREELYSKSIKQKHANARHYLWLILHCHYGESNSSIAKRYGRARVTVIQYITQLKFRVEHQRDDIQTYNTIIEVLDKEGNQ